MPNKTLKGMAKKTGKSKADLERYWNDAKKSAKGKGKNKYAYMMGIVKKRAGMESKQPEQDRTNLGEFFNQVMEKIARAVGTSIQRFGTDFDIKMAIMPHVQGLPKLLSSDVDRVANAVIKEFMLRNKLPIVESCGKMNLSDNIIREVIEPNEREQEDEYEDEYEDQYEDEDEDEEEIETAICGHCAGHGCHECHGEGEVPVDPEIYKDWHFRRMHGAEMSELGI